MIAYQKHINSLNGLNKIRIAPSGHGRALHSLILQYLQSCLMIQTEFKNYNIIPYMDLRKKSTGYHDIDDIFYEKNPWNNYFIQPPIEENELFKIEMCSPNLDTSIGVSAGRERFFLYKKIKDKYLLIHPHILNKVDEFIKNNFSGKVAGIHIRGTDSFYDKTRPHLPISFYKKLISEKLGNYSKILICTDCYEIIEDLKMSFNDKIIFYNVYRSEIQNYNKSLARGIYNPYKSGEDALIDSLLMSKVDLLIRTTSNMTTFSLIENPNLNIHCVDLKFHKPNMHGYSYGYVTDLIDKFTDKEKFYLKELEISDMEYYLEKSNSFENEKFKCLDTGTQSELTLLIKDYFFS